MSQETLHKPSSDWEAYKSLAKRDVAFADFAYTSELELPDENYYISQALKDFQSNYKEKSLEEKRDILESLATRASGMRRGAEVSAQILGILDKVQTENPIDSDIDDIVSKIPVSSANININEELDKIAKKLPQGFQLFFCSDSLEETNKHKYRAVAFVNNNTKEVVVATSGTRFGLDAIGRQDIYDDMFILFEKEPPKMKSVREFNSMLVDSLGSELSDYKIHYTGHSLGAGISDMAAADLAIKCRKKGLTKLEGMPDISTMTFENPGAKKVIEKMYIEAGFDKSEYSRDVDYKGINNGKNFVNGATKHAGTVWEIEPKDHEKPNMFQLFLMYVASKLEPFLVLTPKILNTIAFGNLTNQIDSHKLAKIEDFLCSSSQKVDTVENINRTNDSKVEKNLINLSSLLGNLGFIKGWAANIERHSSNSRGL